MIAIDGNSPASQPKKYKKELQTRLKRVFSKRENLESSEHSRYYLMVSVSVENIYRLTFWHSNKYGRRTFAHSQPTLRLDGIGDLYLGGKRRTKAKSTARSTQFTSLNQPSKPATAKPEDPDNKHTDGVHDESTE